MFSNSQTRALQNAFLHLQDRLAYSLRGDWHEHAILVSVSVSDRQGNIQATIQPDAKSSSRTMFFTAPSNDTQFATGIQLSTKSHRVAAMCEVAAYVWSLAADEDCVVSATFQDNIVGSNTPTDYVAQCFQKDGALIIKEKDIVDRG